MAPTTHPPDAGFAESIVSAALHAARRLQGPRPVLALSGLQGSGKSTLARQLAGAAAHLGLSCAVLSLDDFYLDRRQRQQLARDVHPLLATRGPPGTHDVQAACMLLQRLRAGECPRLPRFDKLADDPVPESRWPRLSAPADLIVFEGWCLGVPPQREDELELPLNPLEAHEDVDGQWRRWCNAALARDYPALWREFDALWFLQPPGFDCVIDWRWQQEQQLQAAQPGRLAMDRSGIERFVQYFERVSRQALRELPARADQILRLDRQRRAWWVIGG